MVYRLDCRVIMHWIITPWTNGQVQLVPTDSRASNLHSFQSLPEKLVQASVLRTPVRDRESEWRTSASWPFPRRRVKSVIFKRLIFYSWNDMFRCDSNCISLGEVQSGDPTSHFPAGYAQVGIASPIFNRPDRVEQVYLTAESYDRSHYILSNDDSE